MNNEIEWLYEKKTLNIFVIGVGKGGIESVNMMHEKGIAHAKYLICDTDDTLLRESRANHQIHIKNTHSLSEDNKIELKEYTQLATILFVFAGMGGDIGENLLHEIIETINKQNIFTICILTIPYTFEGVAKIEKAKKGIEQIKCLNNAVIELNSQLILQQYPETKPFDAYDKLNNIQFDLLTDIEKSLPWHSYISTDFSDFFTNLKYLRQLVIGSGISEGENRIKQAIDIACKFPLFDKIDLATIDNFYIMIHCSQDYQLRMEEIEQIHLFVDSLRPNIILTWSACFDNNLDEKVEVVVIAGAKQ
ncbi:MAG: hypothetical protein PHS59_11410 [Paludibacter sp.]|nr:hypothetical protein [Paludibacter sp.]